MNILRKFVHSFSPLSQIVPMNQNDLNKGPKYTMSKIVEKRRTSFMYVPNTGRMSSLILIVDFSIVLVFYVG